MVLSHGLKNSVILSIYKYKAQEAKGIAKKFQRNGVRCYMQIKMFTENNINVAVGRVSRTKHQPAQMPGGAFDTPQCKVTISKEGRKLSEQSDRQSTRSAQSLKTEKMLLRQQEQSKQADETQNEYLSLIGEIDKVIKSMRNSNMAGEDQDTIERKQRVIREMRDQKQKQIEENQKKAKEAQQMAMQTSEMQGEIDQGNRDLLIMLKSIEESEKAEEEREGGKTEDGGNGGDKTEKSISDIINNSATQFAASSMKREMDVVGIINELQEEGLRNLAKADEIAQKAFDEADNLKELISDADTTDEEKREAVISYGLKMAPKAGGELEILFGANYSEEEKKMALERYRSMIVSDSDLAYYRRRGMQMVRDAKDCKSEHIAMNSLQGMEETKGSMIQSAVDAAFNEASQGKLDETSQELEEEVKDLIDERNDIDHAESKEEEDEGKEKEIGELPAFKEQPEETEENPPKTDEEKMEEKIIVTQG